jgi:hypothetical protein
MARKHNTILEQNIERYVRRLFTFETWQLRLLAQKATFYNCMLLRDVVGSETYRKGTRVARVVFHIPTYAPWNVRFYDENRVEMVRLNFQIELTLGTGGDGSESGGSEMEVLESLSAVMDELTASACDTVGDTDSSDVQGASGT